MQDRDTVIETDPPAASPAGPAGDAARSPAQTCREVERTLGREPGDRVKCAHLFGDYYRCNWWSRNGRAAGPRSGFDWAGLLTDHVRHSRLIRVTTALGQVRVEEVPEPAAGRGPGPV